MLEAGGITKIEGGGGKIYSVGEWDTGVMKKGESWRMGHWGYEKGRVGDWGLDG